MSMPTQPFLGTIRILHTSGGQLHEGPENLCVPCWTHRNRESIAATAEAGGVLSPPRRARLPRVVRMKGDPAPYRKKKGRRRA